eukprot:scaffold25949_cov137-Cylindrotheca_fusiformis.AAC.3
MSFLKTMGERDKQKGEKAIAVPSADHIDDSSEEKRTLFGVPRKVGFGLVALLVISIIAIAVGVLRSKGDDSEVTAPTEAPKDLSTAPTEAPKDLSKMESLARVVLPGVDIFDLDQTASQYLALKWLAYDDSRNLTVQDDSTELLERFSLASLYYATGGENWIYHLGWLGSTVHCWYPINCDENDRVFNLNLGNNNLFGTLPPEIGNFRNARFVNVASNSIEGSIPTEVGLLTSVKELFLNDNVIQGTLPTEIGNLNGLEILNVAVNQLVGTIPNEVGNMRQLNYLTVGHNSFSGSIPNEIGNLQHLLGLDLRFNTLLGIIPSEIGNIQQLEYLFLSDNALLTGTVPMEVGQLESIIGAEFQNTSLTGGLDDPSFCWHQDNQYFSLRADCKGSKPKITCDCCTTCCNSAGEECVHI